MGAAKGRSAAITDRVEPQDLTASNAPPQSGTPAYLQQAYDLQYLSQTAGGSRIRSTGRATATLRCS